MFILPLQHAPQEFLSPKIMPRLVFRPPEVFLHRGLRPDPGMIHPWQPKNFKASHPGTAGENILNGVVEHVTERKHTCDIRRRHHYRERRF
jgi:hypothetical protein